MTTEQHDPWALLREARGRTGFCECGDEACERAGDFARRIDSALARHDAAKSAAIAAARGLK